MRVCAKGRGQICFVPAFFAWHHESKWAHNIAKINTKNLNLNFLFEMSGCSNVHYLNPYCTCNFDPLLFSVPYVSPTSLEKNRPDTISQLSLHSGSSQNNSRSGTLERQTPRNFPESLQRNSNSTIQEVIWRKILKSGHVGILNGPYFKWFK